MNSLKNKENVKRGGLIKQHRQSNGFRKNQVTFSPQVCGLFSTSIAMKEGRELATATSTKVRLKPLDDRVVVKKLDAEEKTAGGIVIPDTAKEKPQQGEILAVGPGKLDDNGKRQPMELKEGDKVLFAKYSGTEVKLDGIEYVIMAERDILAVIS